MQAAIRLLALSNLELQAEVTAELADNPLLELASDSGDSDSRDSDGNSSDGSDRDRDRDSDRDDRDGAGSDSDTALAEGAALDQQLGDDRVSLGEDLDVDLAGERFHHDGVHDGVSDGGDAGGEFPFDQVAEGGVALAVHLERQAAHLPPGDRAIVVYLISLLDEAGYLSEPLPAVAARLGVALAEVERCLTIVQTFEPTGIGARSLAECIALQAREADRYDPCMATLIANLDLVARGDLAQLRRVCGVDQDDLADMLRELRGYDPKPGLAFGASPTMVVVPDIFVRRGRKDGVDVWLVELNSATLPRVIVNRQYRARVEAHGQRCAARADSHAEPAADGRADPRSGQQFLEQCMSRANWLIRALDQRATTILKVAQALVETQQGFFTHGVSQLRPLTLRQIADEIGMHESTVSRVTSNKYLACDRGVFELKYFFSSAIAGAGGQDDAAGEAVRQRVRELIAGEQSLSPLSDEKLAGLLKAEGFDIARRTVAKYRESLHIPSSFDRRRRALLQSA